MDVRVALDLLGVNSENDLTVKELKKAFKRKSLSMLPEKHPTIANAHSQFEEVNEAFLKVKLRTELKSYHNTCVVRAGSGLALPGGRPAGRSPARGDLPCKLPDQHPAPAKLLLGMEEGHNIAIINLSP